MAKYESEISEYVRGRKRKVQGRNASKERKIYEYVGGGKGEAQGRDA
ncbi:unnamed protein product [marine sediment metagenome]|uniref:Uncharacterized protein n=1 Tax=marine sediment metagenome TaxID=412755 RepID=X1MTW3_9ZZZZ